MNADLRLLIPGVAFLTPLYILFYIIVFSLERDAREGLLLTGFGALTALPALAIPVGWVIYNAYRAIRSISLGGYETSPFIRFVRNHLKAVYDPFGNCILVNLGVVHDSQTQDWRSFSIEDFKTVFYQVPFQFRLPKLGVPWSPPLRPRATPSELIGDRFSRAYLEPVSDCLLFADKTYDYARSLSTARYGFGSGFFGLSTGIVFVLLLYSLYQELQIETHLHERSNGIFDTSVIGLILLFLFFGTLSIYRWWFLTAEYRSRLLLISIRTSSHSRVDLSSAQFSNAPFLSSSVTDAKFGASDVAAFDMDNTLLDGDFGEAVFAWLLRAGKCKWNWEDYVSIRNEEHGKAYTELVRHLCGIGSKEIERAARAIISTDESYIQIDKNQKVKIPKPNPTMQQLITYINTSGSTIVVLTASEQIAAQTAISAWFGLSADAVFGIRDAKCKLSGKFVYSGDVQNPIPYGLGKREVLFNLCGRKSIKLAAGDSEADLPFMSLIDKSGVVLWVTEKAKHLGVAPALPPALRVVMLSRDGKEIK